MINNPKMTANSEIRNFIALSGFPAGVAAVKQKQSATCNAQLPLAKPLWNKYRIKEDVKPLNEYRIIAASLDSRMDLD